MVHPYRTPGRFDENPRDSTEVGDEERVLAWMALVVGGLRVAVMLVSREPFEAESTIAIVMVAAGMLRLFGPRRR
ncbi:MAG TPA: hypothetical protein VGM90_06905 [Kofleriaceae bacterium]|jgi:hypothetical protein